MDIGQIIQTLSQTKKALQQLSLWKIEDRLHFLSKCSEFVTTLDDQKYIAQPILKQIESTKSQLKDFTPRPQGLHLIAVSEQLQIRLILERLIPSILAGNACVIVLKNEDRQPELQNLKTLVGGEFFSWVIADENSFELLIQHPSVNLISFVGSPKNMQKIKSLTAATNKIMQLQGGSWNSLLILDESYKEKWDLIMDICFYGNGELCWNAKQILIPEALQKDFLLELHKHLEEHIWKKTFRERLIAIQTTVEKEKGKIIFSNDSALVTSDFHHCSELFQEELRVPVVFVSAVKYAHEMAKWVNNTSFGHSVVMIGEYEKCVRLAPKYEVGRVFINSWIDKGTTVFGVKESAAGVMDSKFFGEFYTRRQIVD